MQTTLNIQDIVNVERYHIGNSHAAERQSLVEGFRKDLWDNNYCVLSDFVRPAALTAMADEAKGLQEKGYHNNALRNCYLHRQQDASFPHDHARNLQDRSSTRMIAFDQIATESPLKRFYTDDGVRSFIADVVGEGELFGNEDPYQPANYVCYEDGDESSWHFDADNSFTMTLMIQPADLGGNFEMSPNTRTDGDQQYDKVADVLNASNGNEVISVGREAGAVCLFRGCNSLHRVTPVSGDVLRIMGVFVYETSPGVRGDAEVNATIYGPRVAQNGNAET